MATSKTPIPFPPEPEGPLVRPTNRETRRIFVAATRMNHGKTTTCLGLFAALQSLYPRVGFIKPVGQRFVRVQGHEVDEDSYLLDAIFNVQVPIESMSPVTVDSNFTRRFLTHPAELLGGLVDKICRAFDRVSWEKDFTIIEGTGHAGVGSVFELSNARVARLLGARAIIVAQGGIGRPVDEIALNKALFDKEGVPVIGAILNKVDPDKIDTVREYAGKGIARLGIPLLGILPEEKMLSSPNLPQIAEEIGGRWIHGREFGERDRILRVVLGAATADVVSKLLEPGALIITPGDRTDIIHAVVDIAQALKKKPVAGIVLTDGLLPDAGTRKLLAAAPIPVLASELDVYELAYRVHNMTVKTQPEDSDKIPVIKNMIMNNVDMTRLLAQMEE